MFARNARISRFEHGVHSLAAQHAERAAIVVEPGAVVEEQLSDSRKVGAGKGLVAASTDAVRGVT